MKSIRVLTELLPQAAEELNKLIKKAKRIGSKPLSYVVGPTTVEKTRYNGRTVEVEYTELILTEDLVQVQDHEFLAHIELTEAGVLIDAVPGTDISLVAAFKDTDARCEHCNVLRRRKDVYVVREKATGQLKQIGRNCLQDYMGISPAAVAARFSFLAAFVELGNQDGEGGFGRLRYYERIEEILAATVTVVRMYGWTSKQQAEERQTEATANHVSLMLSVIDIHTSESNKQKILAMRREQRPADKEVARDVVEFVRSADFTGDSEYVHNLKVLFSQEAITQPRRFAIVVSAYVVFVRAQEQAIRRSIENRPSTEYLGEVGLRIKLLPVTIEFFRQVGEGQFGPTYLFKFRDEAGHVLTWFTGNNYDVTVGEQVKLTGTVKAHNEYMGSRETLMTRCKLD